MIHSKIMTYMGFDQMDHNLRSVAFKYSINDTFRNFSLFLLNTYLVLYLLEFISISELGIIVSAKFLAQLLLDYPSGALGDKISQRNIILTSYFGHFLSTIIFILANSFGVFLFGAIVQGISNSQESGALISWFDSEYKILNQNKNEIKDSYTQFMGSMVTLGYLSTGLGIFVGGLIASSFSRLFLLQIYLITMILNIFIVYLTISFKNKQKTQSNSYFEHIKQSINFLSFNKPILNYYIGVN